MVNREIDRGIYGCRRSPYEVIYQILIATKRENCTNKTHISNYARLTHPVAETYIKLAERNGLLIRNGHDPNEKPFYVLEKGERFIEIWSSVREVVGRVDKR